ncbi:MAG TPA: amidohydrolase, partial [Candidatus Sulfopaludibacter sp.]|nr:amidohydrolase [Candidatus Sulfopaludibacter sp.]
MRTILAVLVLVAGGALVLVEGRPAADRTVTVKEGTNLAATISPDGGTIVMDLQGALWSLPFRGGTSRRLTDAMLEPARPDYSPKGGLVAFQAYQGGTFHIWTMKPDGSGARQITSGHGDDREPRFSPDGARIAFASDRAFEGSYDIWVVDLGTGSLTRRTSAAADEYEPAWSPDGSGIAFVSGTGTAGTAIQAVNAAGVARTLETAPAGAHLNSPTWSPDGTKIAYVQFLRNHSRLMVSGKQAAPEDDVFPFPARWLAGNRLLYTANGQIRVTQTSTGETQSVPFAASFTLHRAAYTHKRFDLDSPGRRPVKGIVGPALSPDGKRVVFEALNQLWVMEIGGKPQALTSDASYKEDPAWSPDGKRIAYASDKAGTEDLYVLDLASKRETRVTKLDGSA